MEIEGKDGSKFQLKVGLEIDFGRGLGFDSTDRTVSRRHVSFHVPTPNHKDEIRVRFKVIGKNPIWVRHSSTGEIRVCKRFERSEMESGYMFCISAKKPVWFILKSLELEGENKNRTDTESGLEIELDESLQSSFGLRGIEELEIGSIDISTFDPVKGIGIGLLMNLEKTVKMMMFVGEKGRAVEGGRGRKVEGARMMRSGQVRVKRIRS